ncbi:MAG: GHKL domain-containing protein [Butyrivibrio sp.]|nr:GHKL domain-containing protein [Acetatifactor muris]MCM1558295.1 GHKL domain-containing protein [Butyrivibrio sp.]
MADGMLTAMDAVVFVLWGWCLYRFCGGFLTLKARRRQTGRDAGAKEAGRKAGGDGGVRPGRINSLRNGWPMWCFWVAWKELFTLLVETDFDTVHSLIRTALTYGGLLLFLRIFYQGRRGTLLFSFVTFTAVSEISRFLAHAASLLGNGLYDAGVWLFEEGVMSAKTYLLLAEIYFFLVQIFMNVVFLVFLRGTLRRVSSAFHGEIRGFDRAELKFLLLPGCIAGMFCALLRVILVTVEEQIPSSLYDRYPLLMGVVPVLLVLCLCSVVYSVRWFCELKSLHEEKNRSMILGQQLESMEEHLRETERVYAGVRAMKHDMKNQLAVVAELAGQPDARPGLQAYLAQLNQTLSELDFPCRTGSAAVDTLVGIKYHEMRERIPGISFQVENLLVPPDLKVSPMDLSLILGNGLDNAIEACERLVKTEAPPGGEADAGQDRAEQGGAEQSAAEQGGVEQGGTETEKLWIRAGTGMRGALFLLEIANSYDGRLKYSPGQEFPETLKEADSLHGIGLQSIKSTAQKYRGGVDWKAEAGVFTLTVMLRPEKGL